MKLLKTTCEVCGEALNLLSCVQFGVTTEDDELARFDECVNGHKVNMRPYTDSHYNYIYEDQLNEKIQQCKLRLKELIKLKYTPYLDHECGICGTPLREVLEGKGSYCCQDYEIALWSELHPNTPHPWEIVFQ